MNSFAAWLRKEILEGARSYRFLILGVAVAFFAFLDPLMLKLLPLIMKAQVGADMGALIPASRDFAFETFLGDLFEILSLVACLALGGCLAKERAGRLFVIPVSKGASFVGIVLAKALAYALFFPLVLFPGAFASYLYAGLLFPGSSIDPSFPLRAALDYSLYFAYLVALIVLASSLAPSAAIASLASLAAAYGLPALAALFRVERFFPSYLALGSQRIAGLASADFLPAALSAAAAVVVSLSLAARAMGKADP